MTPTSTPIHTWTPTATPPAEIFRVCKNLFNVPIDGQVCIIIGTGHYPGRMSLKIYNSAGEHIITLYDNYLTQALMPTTINWNGTNKYGNNVASGVYILYLIKPDSRLLAKILVLH
jgi:hypothetical protein